MQEPGAIPGVESEPILFNHRILFKDTSRFPSVFEGSLERRIPGKNGWKAHRAMGVGNPGMMG